jgi:predicted RNA methylase
MKIKTVNIDADVEAVLRSAKLDGNKLILQGQLDRALYVKVMKVLELIGFKWNRQAKCHIGEGDSADKLVEALGNGKVVDEKKTYQFFETPKQVADRIVALAGIKPGDRVLEPSAGRGAIIDAIWRRPKTEVPSVIFACDINPKHVQYLKDVDAERGVAAEMNGGYKQVVVAAMDFLDHKDLYDRIVMNPPFTAGQDVQHVLYAYALLLPGGRLVAVMSTSWRHNSAGKFVAFREWINDLCKEGRVEVEDLPVGTFKESGTDIATVIVSIDKPNAKPNAEHEPRAVASRVPCSCSTRLEN